MCKHVVFIFACQDLASGPIVTEPCRYGCGLVYLDSADLHHGFNAPYRIRPRASIDVEYINLDMLCEDCDPFFDPFGDVGFDRAYDGVWHVPAVPMREMEIFKDFAWNREWRVIDGQRGRRAVDSDRQHHNLDVDRHGLQRMSVTECASPKSMPPGERTN